MIPAQKGEEWPEGKIEELVWRKKAGEREPLLEPVEQGRSYEPEASAPPSLSASQAEADVPRESP